MSENGMPVSDANAIAENLRFLLMQNIGGYVVVELWFGGGEIQRRCGLLTSVGSDCFLLEDTANNQHIAGEIASIKLVTFCAAAAVPLSEDQSVNGVSADEAQHELEQLSITQARIRPHAQAAFNYTKRKARKLD